MYTKPMDYIPSLFDCRDTVLVNNNIKDGFIACLSESAQCQSHCIVIISVIDSSCTFPALTMKMSAVKRVYGLLCSGICCLSKVWKNMMCETWTADFLFLSEVWYCNGHNIQMIYIHMWPIWDMSPCCPTK